MNESDFTAKTSLYFSGYTRVIAATVVSVILILLSTKSTFLELIETRSFYSSLCIGFLIAITIIEFIYWLNVLLDYFYPWQKKKWHRIPVQFLIGVLPLVYLDWLMVKGMYIMTKNNFEQSGFTEKILPINMMLICCGHLMFYLHHRYQLKKAARLLTLKSEEKKNGQHEMIYEKEALNHSNITSGQNPGDERLVHYSEKHQIIEYQSIYQYWTVISGSIQNKKYTFPINEVFCLSTATVYGDIYLKDGKNMNMSFRRKGLRKYLDPNKFVEIRGGVFVAYDVIAGIKTEGNMNMIIFKTNNRTDLQLSISRRFLEKFRKGFKSYQVNKYQYVKKFLPS